MSSLATSQKDTYDGVGSISKLPRVALLEAVGNESLQGRVVDHFAIVVTTANPQ
jgi:hypothetical protein